MPYVNVDTPWGASPKSEIIVSSTNTPPSSVWQKVNGSRLTQVKARPEYNFTEVIDGWREPTVFRGYAVRVDYPKDIKDFYYEGFNVSGVGIIHKGDHYFHNSASLYCGMSGAAHYPIDVGQDAIARSLCIANLDKSDIQLGITLVEFGKTITMLSEALVNLHKYMSEALRFLKRSTYRRHHVQRILRLSATPQGRREIVKYLGKGAANRWLEYQYGWRSLMFDVYGLQEAVELAATKSHRITGKARYQTGTEPSYPFVVTNGEIIPIGGVRAGAYCRMDWEIENAVARTYNRLGLLNPLEIMWEAIPFSFVIDWVLPIGNYLTALAGGWGLTYLGGSITRYSTADYHVYWTQYRYKRGTRIQYFLRSVSWFRYPISDTSGRLYITNPLTSVSRATTALALFTQLSKG